MAGELAYRRQRGAGHCDLVIGLV